MTDNDTSHNGSSANSPCLVHPEPEAGCLDCFFSVPLPVDGNKPLVLTDREIAVLGSALDDVLEKARLNLAGNHEFIAGARDTELRPHMADSVARRKARIPELEAQIIEVKALLEKIATVLGPAKVES